MSEDRVYKLNKGDRFALSYSYFKKRPRVGDFYEDTPIIIRAIRYCKRKEITPLPDVWRDYKWWMFWVRKKRILVICEYLGEGIIPSV